MQLVNLENLIMTSLQIANLVKKRHDNVKRTIESLVNKGVIAQPQFEDEQNKDSVGRTRLTSSYVFSGAQGKRDSIIVVAQLSSEFTAKLVDRWQELEQKELDKENRKLTRNAARLENPIMNNALQTQRKLQGKDTSHFHYSNESDMINRIAIGLKASDYRKENGLDKNDPIRDHVTKCELECIEHLQRVNASLIDIGMGYEERKQRLSDLYQTHHKERLTAEFLRLEA